MKRKIILSLLFLFIFALVFHYAYSQEKLTISTYYPSPFGVYNVVKLHPNSNPPSCAVYGDVGNIYYDNDANSVTVNSVMLCAWDATNQQAYLTTIGGTGFNLWQQVKNKQNIYYDLGDVGVGSQPVYGYPFEVDGPIRLTDHVNIAAFNPNSAKAKTELKFEGAAGGKYFKFRNYADKFKLFVENAPIVGGESSVVTIDRTGQVGIGNSFTDPDALLHIRGHANINPGWIRLEDPGSPQLQMGNNAVTSGRFAFEVDKDANNNAILRGKVLESNYIPSFSPSKATWVEVKTGDLGSSGVWSNLVSQSGGNGPGPNYQGKAVKEINFPITTNPDTGGGIKINSKPPIKIRRYSNCSGGTEYTTSVICSSNDPTAGNPPCEEYYCTVGGFSANYNPRPSAGPDYVWTFVKKNADNIWRWYVKADFHDDDAGANANIDRPDIDVICFRSEMVEWLQGDVTDMTPN